MTTIEKECRFEWIEAAIQWHREQAMRHYEAVVAFGRLHTQVCRSGRLIHYVDNRL